MSFKVNSGQQISFNDSVFSLTAREKKALDNSWAKIFADEIFPNIDEHSLLQRMLQTGQRAKGICKVKNSAIMQSLGMA